MIRALIIDDVQLARERLKRCLAGEPEIQVVGECDSGTAALASIRSLSPDLIFLSVERLTDAKDVALRIDTQLPGAPIVAVNRTCDGPAMLEILRAGAKDFRIDGRKHGTISLAHALPQLLRRSGGLAKFQFGQAEQEMLRGGHGRGPGKGQIPKLCNFSEPLGGQEVRRILA